MQAPSLTWGAPHTYPPARPDATENWSVSAHLPAFTSIAPLTSAAVKAVVFCRLQTSCQPSKGTDPKFRICTHSASWPAACWVSYRTSTSPAAGHSGACCTATAGHTGCARATQANTQTKRWAVNPLLPLLLLSLRGMLPRKRARTLFWWGTSRPLPARDRGLF